MTHAERGRPLTPGEIAMARPAFGDAIRWNEVRLHHRPWWPLQPRNVIMAPDGHIWFPPGCPAWCDDFSTAPRALQHLFIHELTHVWQVQTRGRLWLWLRRHPFCRYRYTLRDGWPLERYGVEQQAEIVADAWAGGGEFAAAALRRQGSGRSAPRPSWTGSTQPLYDDATKKGDTNAC